ncbi:hypothetical protein KSP39_PZI006994 [Platanthera zijinensis]|uniref:Calmodulin-binding protein n=1 Tax=Platanthera zijinensis TaxID=2320716 RepID=A0AAP0GAE4_9ASPA
MVEACNCFSSQDFLCQYSQEEELIEGEQGASIHVVLIDANTGHVITSEPESSAKLDIVVLEGDFNNADDEDSTGEEFENHVVKEREGKRPLLTDNSSWIRSRKFRLGLKISSGYCDAIRIREGKTEAFTVKDHGGEFYKKHYPPSLKDEVWRLEKIGKDGAFHKKLNKAGIHIVEHFLHLLVRHQQRLRNILGSGMPNKMWDILIEHVKTCRSRSTSGKAVVGWLKIKAAMRWGIFIRKKAAERRAQIIEL